MTSSTKLEDKLEGIENFRAWKYRIGLILQENDLDKYILNLRKQVKLAFTLKFTVIKYVTSLSHQGCSSSLLITSSLLLHSFTAAHLNFCCSSSSLPDCCSLNFAHLQLLNMSSAGSPFHSAVDVL